MSVLEIALLFAVGLLGTSTGALIQELRRERHRRKLLAEPQFHPAPKPKRTGVTTTESAIFDEATPSARQSRARIQIRRARKSTKS